MATYEVTAPDGSKFDVTAPDGATEDEVLAYVKANYQQKPEYQQRIDKMPPFMRALAGGGEAALQAITGLGSTVTGGIAGLGNLAFGGNDPASTVRSIQEAMTYQPRTEQGRTASKVLGFPGELYTKGVRWAGDKVRGDDSGGTRDFLATTLEVGAEAAPAVLGGVSMLKSARNRAPMTRTQQTLAEAQKEGYVVPPSQAGKASLLEGAGGKIRTAQRASAQNVEVTNRLAARELGLPENVTITTDLLKNMREAAYKRGYEPLKGYKSPIVADDVFLKDVLDMSRTADRVRIDFPNITTAGADKVSKLADGVLVQQMTAEGAVELIKSLRSEARRNLSWKAQPNADAVAYGQAQLSAARALETLIERNLEKTGNAPLLSGYRQAREMIAKTHSVENALNDATGTVSARALASGKDADALTGGLRTASRFAQAFPKANQLPEIFGGTPPISPLDVSMGTIAAMGGQLATGNATGALAGGIPLLRPMAAPMALSGPVQSALVRTPANYGAMPYLFPWLNLANQQDQELSGRQ